MEIAVTSDLHGYLDFKLESQIELFLVGGDIFPNEINSVLSQELWLTNTFIPKIKSLGNFLTLLVAGNHDRWFEVYSENETKLKKILGNNIIYLHNSFFEYFDNEGNYWKIFGTPFCKVDGNMSFMMSDKMLCEIYNTIPTDIDILISHDTPRFLEFSAIKETEGNYNTFSGNLELKKCIDRIKPKYIFCGHIHYPTKNLVNIGPTRIQNVSQKFYKINTEKIYQFNLSKIY